VEKRPREHTWIATSAASLDRGPDIYLSLIGELLTPTAGVLLILLAVDQARRVTRRLD
jgi:hypothetical protein